MKRIQVLVDEPLLKRLQADPEVKRAGLSVVLRRVAAAYLKRSARRRISEAYARGYAGGEGLRSEWSGWASEGASPEE